ncbi:MAG: arsenate reductase (glutaredoxin) [Cruoricaptor ignavus]|nr:arsenate reductase (glutaredoxin) [Cruoricaptor ignavus]
MFTILHNARCSKSRSAIAYLEEKGQEFEVRYYLENPLDKSEIEQLLQKLGLNAIDIVRTNETLWKEEFAGKDFTNDELIQILVENPKLIERPIIVKDDKAVVGRPTENIDQLL